MPVVGEEIRTINVGGVDHPVGDVQEQDYFEVVKDTNGWIGKNFLKVPSSFVTKTVKGVTFTVNRNSQGYVTSIVLSGTATQNAEVSFNMDVSRLEATKAYYLTGWVLTSASGTKNVKATIHPSSGDDVVLSIMDEKKIYTYAQNTTAVFKIFVESGVTISATLYPMLSKTEIGDLTFEPYHDTVDELLSHKQDTLTFDNVPTAGSNNPVKSSGIKAMGDANVDLLKDTVGWTGKQLIPFPYYDESPLTLFGVTFTVNADGGVTIQTDSGGATNNAVFLLIYNSTLLNDKAVKGYVSKSKTDLVYESDIEMTYSVRNSDNTQKWSARGTSIDIPLANSPHTADGEYLRIMIRVASGKVITTPITVYPLICLPSVTDTSYEPYHSTVDESKANTSALAPVENGSTASQAYAQGAPFMRFGDWCIAKTAIASGATLVENSNYEVKKVSDSMQNIITSATLGSGASSIGVTLNDADKTVVRYGNVVNFKVGITVAETITASGGKQIVELGYVPILASPKVVVNRSASPYETLDNVFPIDSSGRIIVKSGVTLEAGSYEMIGTYICK